MRALLQFSGGKDSLALVYKMEALLPHIDVVMLDTGDMPDAAHRNADEVRKIAPNFDVLHTNSPFYRKLNGDPSSGDWTKCCTANIWMPMMAYVRENGYRQVFRGTKRCDPYIHGVMPGDVVDGVIYTLPLWDWSDADVRGYLGRKLPSEYFNVESMPDCVSCPVVESCGGKNRQTWRK